MKQIKETITILILLLKICKSLPVTSKALENSSDQLIYAAYSYSNAKEDRKESPFTGESKKITAKSIFITPNFNQNTICPSGFKVDDNGKCIKIVSINQGERFMTSFFDKFLIICVYRRFAVHTTSEHFLPSTSNYR